MHRAEREPRDRQPRQRRRDHAGRGLDAAEMSLAMSEEFLNNPLSLFASRGETAALTGATGACGALAAKVLAGAGANGVICASKADALRNVAAECEKLGGKVEIVARRPSSESNCDAIVEAAVGKFGRVDILVVASGQNKVSKICDHTPGA